ncbi:MAG TPA: histone deacetylase [Candidatus Limnocylindria bacterium]
MPGPVWLLTDAAMDRHTVRGHPERPERRNAAAAGVVDAAGDAVVTPAVAAATDEELRLVHDAAYLEVLADADGQGGGWLDPDTYLVPGSWPVARLAAGATIQAARAVAAGEAAVACAMVRPPGHHAASARGTGFCLLNNIALAAAVLRADGVARRIAILDWDVHHGDGTQAIFDADPDLLYASTHQAPFYPGTGAATDRGTAAGVGTKLNRPLLVGDGDEAFVAAWRDELLPAVDDFRPDAILVSAGYDAHLADPLAGLAVTEAGYEAVGRELGAMAARLGLGGVTLTLEGGYDLDALRASVAASVLGILRGSESA